MIGLSRSGNHAVIEWLRRQMTGSACVLNCAEGKQNPFLTARPTDSGAPYFTNDRRFDFAAEQGGRFSRKEWLIITYEDSFLGHACSDEYEGKHDRWVGRSALRRDVLILRDPFNLMASRLHAGPRFTGVPPAVAMRIWKQHARQFTGRPRGLRHDPLLVSYNAWCASADYRREIAEALGLRFNDAGRERVARCHGGSSFDRLRYDGRASRMPVGERWRRYANDPDYRALFDSQTLKLAGRVFGELPAARQMFAAALRPTG